MSKLCCKWLILWGNAVLAADRWPHDFRCGWKFSFAFRLYLTQLNLFQLIFLAGCEYKARLVYSILSEWVWTSHQSYWGKWSVFWGFSSGSSLSEPWMPFLRFSTPFSPGHHNYPTAEGLKVSPKNMDILKSACEHEKITSKLFTSTNAVLSLFFRLTLA